MNMESTEERGGLWKLCRCTMRREVKTEWMGCSSTCGRGVKETCQEASCFPSLAIASCPALSPVSFSSMCQDLGYPGRTELLSFEWKDFTEWESADLDFPKHFWGFFQWLCRTRSSEGFCALHIFAKLKSLLSPWQCLGPTFSFK